MLQARPRCPPIASEPFWGLAIMKKRMLSFSAAPGWIFLRGKSKKGFSQILIRGSR